MGERRSVVPGPALRLTLVPDIVVGGVQNVGLLTSGEFSHFRPGGVHVTIGNRTGQPPVFRGELVEGMVYLGGSGWPVVHRGHQLTVSHPAYRVRGYGMGGYLVQQVGAGAGHVDQCQ